MKKLMIISGISVLLIANASVSFAERPVHKVPKKEKKFTMDELVKDLHALEISIAPVDGMVAVMPDPTFIPGRSSSFLKEQKPPYLSPNVDRKWVWWYSMKTNS